MACWSWMILLAAALPAVADTEFRVRIARGGTAAGAGECDIRLLAKGEATVTVQGDLVRVAGSEARNEKSECTAPLPDGEAHGFVFDGRQAELVEAPSDANGHKAVVKIPGVGHYEFRLTWDLAPAGFSRNNAVRFKSHGRGEARVGETRVDLLDIDVAMDLGGKIVVSFRTEDKGTLVFGGVVNERRKDRWRADVVCEGPQWHVQGPMFLTVDQSKDRVMAATLEATDGRDRMSLNWTYSRRVPHVKKK